ncbi:MAG TPA: hypothetical protein VF407_06545, partial [Polyangiaceae bacterium]
MNMAAEKQGGSDLDIFEGLGKKASQTKTQSSTASAPPPPPSSLRAPPPAPAPQVVRGDMTVGKKTLLGVQSPVGNGAAATPGAPPPSQRAIPAARGSLPDISAPPKKNPLAQSGAQPVAAPPSAAETKPAGFIDQAKAAASVEMDWDDDEEATHVLDRDESKPPSGENPAFAKTALASTQQSPARQAPPPSSASMVNRGAATIPASRPSQAPPLPKPGPASMRPATSVSAPPPPPAPPSANFRSAPPAPPGSVSRPPPPPGMSQPPPQPSFGQMGQAAGSFPPPSAQNPFQQPTQSQPPQIHTAPMAMPGPQQSPSGPPRASVPPPSLPPVQSAPQIHMKSRMMEETQMVRPSSNRNLFIGLGLALVAVIVGVVLLMPHNAKLAINVVDAKGAT